jgi:serine/threonine protein kinase
MGLVYRARQRRPDRIVALKVISPEAAADPEFRTRFEREAAIAAEIEHPNVIPVYEIGEDGESLYIAMRFVEGVDLGDLLVAHGRVEPGRTGRLIAQVADALDAAHAHGLVHRDVKPGNVLVTATDHVYLTDFGITKRTDDAVGLTKTGALVGTADYIAPEQIEGHSLDGRADVYALGSVTYQLLSGHVPFEREAAVAKIFAHLNDPPPRLVGVVPPLADAVQRAMAKRPEDRFPSASEFGRAVMRATSQESGAGPIVARVTDIGSVTSPIAADDGSWLRRFGEPLTVFINYRAKDSSTAARFLYERLVQHFGREKVVIDADLEPSMDRLDEFESSGNHRGAFLVLIGPSWFAALEGRRRAGESWSGEDVVRRDIEWALRDWPGSVIPVLVDAEMPDAVTLPRSLRGLCRKQAAALSDHSRDRDVEVLIERLERISAAGSGPDGVSGSERRDEPHRGQMSSSPALRAASGVAAPHDDHYADVIAGLIEGAVVPVLGSRIRGKLPDADELAAHIATTFNVEAPSHDLAEVAQYVAVTRGERRLYAAMKDAFAREMAPSGVHVFLAALPRMFRDIKLPPRPQLIISTSYDRALEGAFDHANEPFDYAVFHAASGWFVHFPWGEHDAEPIAITINEPHKYTGFPIDDAGVLERTVIVKIHGATDGQEGTFKWMNNYVVTEDQYIDYLPTDNIHKLVPVQILDKLKSSHCLFLGYAMRDWNARVFLRRVWQGESISEKSWVIENEPDVLEKDSWGLVGHVELLAAALPDYVDELRARLVGMRAVPV